MPQPQPPRVVGNLAKDKGANTGSGGNNRGQGNPANPDVAGNPNSPCLISFPTAGIPLVGSVGGGCLFSKTNARALIGGTIFGVGAVVAVAGLALLAAAGFGKTGLGQKTAGVVGMIPGPAAQTAATALRSGGASAVRQRRNSRATMERRQMRAVGEPRENGGLRTGRGAIRETPAGTRRRRAEIGTSSKPASREEAGF